MKKQLYGPTKEINRLFITKTCLLIIVIFGKKDTTAKPGRLEFWCDSNKI
jgi:hypothetical protein